MKRFKVYTPFPSGKMYLGENGADLIIESENELTARLDTIKWIFETSRYSEQMTATWIENHPLCLEEYNE